MQQRLVRTWLTAVGVLGLSACSLLPCTCPPPAPPTPHVGYEAARWGELPGWREDRVRDAWPALLQSCAALQTRTVQWSEVCAAAREATPSSEEAAHAFFEQRFDLYRLVRLTGRHRDTSGLITGYFEPQLHGARTAGGAFATPLYAPPPDLLTVDLGALYPELKGKRVRARLAGHRVIPYYSRAELPQDEALRGQELVWVDSALDAFLLQVQGSGRVELPDGMSIRLQYADENGYPYRSIGRYLIEHGELTAAQADLSGIRLWVAAHPERLQELLNANPSVVFFREEPIVDPAIGPKGSLGVPLTAGRSIAIDRSAVPLGAPVFLATHWPASHIALERLVLAQDTGGAIRGPLRADFFFGTGKEAGAEAGQMREPGELWLLWPKGLPLPPS